jgi:hypothetical protein
VPVTRSNLPVSGDGLASGAVAGATYPGSEATVVPPAAGPVPLRSPYRW